MQRKQTQQEAMCTQYTNKNEVATESSRKREHERFTLRTFVRLFVLDYKRARQDRQVEVIQSVLCEENGRGLKNSAIWN